MCDAMCVLMDRRAVNPAPPHRRNPSEHDDASASPSFRKLTLQLTFTLALLHT
jgi:hypothetical protein